jgi:hypothetical protein
MHEAAETRSYAAALSVLVVAEWLYLDWASRAPKPLPDNFVHTEWITLHDNSDFRRFGPIPVTSRRRQGSCSMTCTTTMSFAWIAAIAARCCDAISARDTA